MLEELTRQRRTVRRAVYGSQTPAAVRSEILLAKVGEGRSIAGTARSRSFLAGRPADAVFYIQKGKVKVTVVSEQGKEAVVAILGPKNFSAKDVLPGRRSASRRSPP